MMPAQKPYRSKQNYTTPKNFLKATYRLLNIDAFVVDLAADAQNTVASEYFSEDVDSLKQHWSLFFPKDSWSWCNPPYSKIGPWVEKAKRTAMQYDRQIAMLVPASVGANWWRDHVDQYAHVYFLNGRLKFGNMTKPYPKDCALLLYSKLYHPGYHVWTWKKSLPIEDRT